MLEVLSSHGDDALARVFVVRLANGGAIECVDALQPPHPLEEKWVLVISTLAGCPVRCVMCDAGGDYQGKLSTKALHAQIDFLVQRRFPDGVPNVRRLKIQFARMGEPSFNPAVLQVLRELPARYPGPGLYPSVSTVAPHGTDAFFEELLAIKDALYPGGRFQLQFSLHATDEVSRRRIVPIRCWSFEQMARFGERFAGAQDRKVTLNFALSEQVPLEPARLAQTFSPSKFLVKLTPLNPTRAAARSGLQSALPVDARSPREADQAVRAFEAAGFEVILAVGEPRENEIGSNCGMYLSKTLEAGADGGYGVSSRTRVESVAAVGSK